MNRKVTYCIINLIAMSSLIFSGCNIIPEKSPKVVYDKPVFNKTIAVMPVEEMRIPTPDFKPSLMLIPLVPYEADSRETLVYDENWGDNSSLDTDYIENRRYKYQKLNSVLIKDIFNALQNSKLFRKTFQVNSNSTKFTNYSIETDLISTKEYLIGTMYGLSILGTIPILLGAPAGHCTYELSLNFRLINNEKKQVVWEKEIKEEEGYLVGLYYGPSATRIILDEYKKLYDYLINQIMVQAMPEIKAAIEKDGVKPIIY